LTNNTEKYYFDYCLNLVHGLIGEILTEVKHY